MSASADPWTMLYLSHLSVRVPKPLMHYSHILTQRLGDVTQSSNCLAEEDIDACSAQEDAATVIMLTLLPNIETMFVYGDLGKPFHVELKHTKAVMDGMLKSQHSIGLHCHPRLSKVTVRGDGFGGPPSRSLNYFAPFFALPSMMIIVGKYIVVRRGLPKARKSGEKGSASYTVLMQQSFVLASALASIFKRIKSLRTFQYTHKGGGKAVFNVLLPC